MQLRRKYILLLSDRMLLSIKFIQSNVSLKALVSLLNFCLDDLFIGVSGVESPTIVISPSMAISICIIEVLLCWMHMYLQLLYLFRLNP